MAAEDKKNEDVKKKDMKKEDMKKEGQGKRDRQKEDPRKEGQRKKGKGYFDTVRKHLKKEGGAKKSLRKDPMKTIVMWLLVGATVIIGLRLLDTQSSLRETKISYSEFKQLLKSPEIRITSAKINQKGLNRAELHGEVDNATVFSQIVGSKNNEGNRAFLVNLPFLDTEMLAEWDSLGFQYSFEGETVNFWTVVLSSWPFILIIIFWIFMIRQMQGGQKGIFSFGKSRAKIQNMDRPKNNFDDVAGVEEAKAELEEIIEFLRDPERFKKLGGKIPKGVLLLGAPGTGKTLLARAVAGEAGVPFLSMSGSDFVEMFVGVGASRVRDLFATAKKSAPSIVFIDEIDAVGRQRGAGLGGGHDEREQTLNQMLVEMDGFEENSGVILIAATNRPDVLDPALLRPGRFDRQVVVPMPDIKGREGILKVHVRDVPLAEDVDLKLIARGTPGFSGADLRNVVNEAALLAARFDQKNVTMLDFEEAKDKVLMGAERRSMVISEKEKESIAYHEAGHAICHIYCPEANPLHKVTIIPRGRALGITFALPEGDKYSESKGYLLDEICCLMGGRAAEEIKFGKLGSGARQDIKIATDVIRRMICDYGMSEELGPLSYGRKEEQIFLGREIATHRDYSEKTAEIIDSLMKDIVNEQLYRARTILKEHNVELERLGKALLEHEMLDLEEINKVINGEVLLEAKKTRPLLRRKKKEESDSTIPSKEKDPEQKVGEKKETDSDKPAGDSSKEPEGSEAKKSENNSKGNSAEKDKGKSPES